MDPEITGVNPMGMKTSLEDLPIIIDNEFSNKDDKSNREYDIRYFTKQDQEGHELYNLQ